jgi:hypothetical protein
VSHQENWLTLAGAAQSGYQVTALWGRFEDVDVFVRESGRSQSGRHRLRSLIGIAHGCSCVDLDELLIDLTREVPLIIEDVGLGGSGQRAAQKKEGTGNDESDWTYSG